MHNNFSGLPSHLTEEEWVRIDTYARSLEPFKTATVMLNADSYPTLSQYFPIVKVLRDMCCEYVAGEDQTKVDLAQNLYDAVEERFHFVNLDNEPLLLAMIVDPRYKIKILGPNQKAEAQSLLQTIAFDL